MDFLTNVRDDSLSRMLNGVLELIAMAESIKHEEVNFLRFYEEMIHVKELLVKLQSQQQGGQFTRGSTGELLSRMEKAVNNARETIDWYKSKNSFERFFLLRSAFFRLNQCSKQITDVLRLLPFTQTIATLDINTTVDAISVGLDSILTKLGAKAFSLDTYVSDNSSSASSWPSPIHNPEIQAWEEEEKETNELTQLLQNSVGEPLSYSYLCLLTGKLMEDPVYVSCHHSFERKSIEEYFRSGYKFCPACKTELSSTSEKLDLKPNTTLRETISEWKQRNTRIDMERAAEKQVREFTARIIPDNVESTNRALEDLEALMTKMPSCIKEVTESSCKLVPKLAELLKKNAVNTGGVLRCLLLITRFSDENKESIGRGGVIKCLLKQGSQNEAIALEILLELSKNSKVALKITETKTSIARLVSLLDNPSSYLAEMALTVLLNLSTTNINSTITMAMAGYLTPFLDQFNSAETSEETRAFMAEELAKIQIQETAVSCFKNELFINNLTVMLICNLLESKLASLKCIKWFMAYDELRSWILSTGYTIPVTLLCFITDPATEREWKQEALEILISLIEKNQPFEQQSNPCLEKLYSCNIIQDLVDQIKTSDHEDQVLLLQLLMAIVKKSDTARDWVISNQKAISCLYSSISPDENREVRLNALKLIYYTAENNPIVLPPDPAKETAMHSIVAILTNDGTDEEISMAANIISHLPRGDRYINELLQSTAILESLKLQITDENKPNELLENALGALLRCIDQSNPQFQMLLASKMEQDIVQTLSIGSPLTKQHAAMILAHLGRYTPESPTSPGSSHHYRRHTWPFSSPSHCTVHKSSCSLQRIICIAKAGAVRPLLSMVDAMNPAGTEAALIAIHTLFDNGNLEPGVSEAMFHAAASTIVENNGVAPVLEVLRKGPPAVKKAAFELFGKIYKHPGITREELGKFKAILFCLLNEEAELSKKAKILIQALG